jgi:hypothetical protein
MSPLSFYLLAKGGRRSPKAAMGATYRVVTRGAEEWGLSSCILHEKELEAASFARKLLNLVM